MWTVENRARYDRSKLRYPTDLTDDEWALAKPEIPHAKRGGNKRTVDEREVMNGLMYVLKDDLPKARPAAPKAVEPSPAASIGAPETGSKRRPAREGKKGVLGHFSPELSQALNILAIEESTTVHALTGKPLICLCALAVSILLESASLLARLRVN